MNPRLSDSKDYGNNHYITPEGRPQTPPLRPPKLPGCLAVPLLQGCILILSLSSREIPYVSLQ